MFEETLAVIVTINMDRMFFGVIRFENLIKNWRNFWVF